MHDIFGSQALNKRACGQPLSYFSSSSQSPSFKGLSYMVLSRGIPLGQRSPPFKCIPTREAERSANTRGSKAGGDPWPT